MVSPFCIALCIFLFYFHFSPYPRKLKLCKLLSNIKYAFSVCQHKWLFLRVLYISLMGSHFPLCSQMAAVDHIFLILVKYFKILCFTNGTGTS